MSTVYRQEVRNALATLIRHDCHRQVNKRLALRLALAALSEPQKPQIFYMQKLVHRLGERINKRAENLVWYL